MRVCADHDCTSNRLYDYDAADARGYEIGTATLTDGTVAAAAWVPQPGTGHADDRPHMLRLLRCGADGCGSVRAAQNAPIMGHSHTDTLGTYAASMTTTHDGIAIATVVPESDAKGQHLRLQLRLIRCADIRCAAPRVVTILRQPYAILSYSRSIAVAAGQDGRPVVAYEDKSARVTVISCDSTECRHPRVTQLTTQVGRNDTGILSDNYMDGVDIAVPPDDRPVLTYRDPRTGAARLLHCRTFDCAQASNMALSGPGPWQSRPALTLDRDGRPLIATYNRSMLVLVACHDFGCDRRHSVALAKFKNGPGFLDLAVRHDGRPVALWKDGLPVPWNRGPLHLTTCARPRCGG